MIELFKIEWLKIKTYRTFWILFLGFVVLFPIAFYFSAYKYMEATSMSAGLEGSMLKTMIDAPYVFPKVWLTSSWIGGLFVIILGMLFILLITNEVQYRTHRQNIIDGWSRVDFLKAKFTLLMFFVLTSTVMVILSALFTGLIFSPSTTSLFYGLKYVGYFALMTTLYLMLAYLIAILIKRTGLAIIIYFAIVFAVDNILWISLTVKGSQLGYFMPLEAGDSLVINPFKPSMLEKRTVSDYYLIMACVAYISIYGYVIYSYFRKTDLKT